MGGDPSATRAPAALATSGCMSPRRFPAATLERTLVPDMGRLSEADIDRLCVARTFVSRATRGWPSRG
jgi:hypothetical protein